MEAPEERWQVIESRVSRRDGLAQKWPSFEAKNPTGITTFRLRSEELLKVTRSFSGRVDCQKLEIKSLN